MKNLKTDDLLHLWSSRISRGYRYRDEQTAKSWDELLRFLLGEQWSAEDPEYPQVNYHAVNNFCWNIIRTYLPALYFQDPHALVRIDPLTEHDLEGMADWENFLTARINQIVRKTNLKRESRKALLNAEIYPYGCFKVGWTALDVETDSSISEPDRPENMDVYCLSVSPSAIILDAQATEPNKSRWIAEQQIHPYLDVANDGRYDAKALKELHPSLWPSDDPHDGGYKESPTTDSGAMDSDIDEIEGYVRIWEVMTMEDGGWMMTFAESPDASRLNPGKEISLDILLRKERLPYQYLRRLPYFFFTFNEIPDVLYAPSDLEMLKPHQKEANYIRSMHLDQVRQQKAVHLYDQGKLGTGNLEKISNAPANSILPIDGPPQQMFYTLTTPPVAPDIYMAEQEIKTAAWQAAGIELTQANQSTKGETATAVGSRAQSGSLRMQDRANTMKEFLEDVVRALLTIWLHENPPELEARQVVDEQTGQPRILQFPVSELNKRFKIVLETQNTFPINRQVEIQQFLQAINLTANFPQVDKREMAKRVFEMFEIKGVDKILPDSPVPRQLIEILEQSPQLLQMVEQMVQQVMMAQQQGGDQHPVGGARMQADVNNNVPRPDNAGGASSAQGGMK